MDSRVLSSATKRRYGFRKRCILAVVVIVLTSISIVSLLQFSILSEAYGRRLGEQAIHHSAGKLQGEKRYSMCALCYVRDEQRNLPEWIEYHHIIGFDQFFIFDDCSRDDTYKVLQDYQSLNLLVPHKHDTCDGWQPKESALIDDLFRSAQPLCEYIMVFNIDEFVTQQTDLYNGSLLSFVKSAGDAHPYVRMLWYTMGTDGRIFAPAGLVTESYFKGTYNPHVKTLMKADVVQVWRFPHHPVEFVPGYEHLLNETCHAFSKPEETQTVDGESVPALPFFLKHYMLKSLTEFLAKRAAAEKTLGFDDNPWRINPLQTWLGQNFSTTAIAGEFTNDMAQRTRAAISARKWNVTKEGRFFYNG